ncbi:MAG: pitrilysin family protein [Candidatus Omnitrophota bacterium]
MDITTQIIDGGITAGVSPMRESNSVAVGFWMRIGGRHESERLGGVSHFLEHLIFKGTPTRTAARIKEAIEGVGGSMNAFTSEECTCFLAKIPKRHFEGVFEVLSDMTLNASLAEQDLERERQVILEEIKMVQDQPSQHVDELLSAILWPGHPLGRPLTGTQETVSAFKRADLSAYKNSFYTRDRMVVSAAGAVDILRLEALVRQYLGQAMPKSDPAIEEDFVPMSGARENSLLKKSTEQTHLALGVHGFCKDHPDEAVLDLINVILGANMSSRLFTQVREERALAYEIGSFVRKYRETGAYIIEAGVAHHKCDEAIRVIVGELLRLCGETIGADELRRAKDFFIGQMELGLESSMSRMLWIGDHLICPGLSRNPNEIASRIEAVSDGDVRRVAAQLFKPESLRLAAIGPQVKKLEPRTLLAT